MSERKFICCTPSLALLPEPSPPPPPRSMEKLSSTKLVPGAKKVGDHCFRDHQVLSSHEMNGETEAQRYQVTSLRSHSK